MIIQNGVDTIAYYSSENLLLPNCGLEIMHLVFMS